jgi:hypothetical protein
MTQVTLMSCIYIFLRLPLVKILYNLSFDIKSHRLHRLAEFIPWNRFLGPINVLKLRARTFLDRRGIFKGGISFVRIYLLGNEKVYRVTTDFPKNLYDYFFTVNR